MLKIEEIERSAGAGAGAALLEYSLGKQLLRIRMSMETGTKLRIKVRNRLDFNLSEVLVCSFF